MPENQLENYDLISIKVIGSDADSFTYNCSTSTIQTNSSIEPKCIVQISSSAYSNLLAGSTTSEEQIDKGNLKILGDVSLLRHLGKAFRAKQI